MLEIKENKLSRPNSLSEMYRKLQLVMLVMMSMVPPGIVFWGVHTYSITYNEMIPFDAFRYVMYKKVMYVVQLICDIWIPKEIHLITVSYDVIRK